MKRLKYYPSDSEGDDELVKRIDNESKVEINGNRIESLNEITSNSAIDFYLDLSQEDKFPALYLLNQALKKCKAINRLSIFFPFDFEEQTSDESLYLCKVFSSIVGYAIQNSSSLMICGYEQKYNILERYILEKWLITSNNITALKIELIYDMSEEAISSICKILTLNYPCEILKINNCDLSDEQIKRIFKSLYHNQNLKWLKLKNDRKLKAPQEELGALLYNNKTLVTLDICYNDIPPKVVSYILASASYNLSIQNLLLGGNKGAFIPKIHNMTFLHNMSLKVLRVGYYGESKNVVDVLIKILNYYPSLELLDYTSSPLTACEFSRFSRAIIKHQSLKILVCYNNSGLTDENAGDIINLVTKSTTLEEVLFNEHRLTERAIRNICYNVTLDSTYYIKNLDNCVYKPNNSTMGSVILNGHIVGDVIMRVTMSNTDNTVNANEEGVIIVKNAQNTRLNLRYFVDDECSRIKFNGIKI